MAKKLNSGHVMQMNAIAMDTIGLKVPQILELLGLDVVNPEEMDKTVEIYGNDFYGWLVEYLKDSLPSHEGDIPESVTENSEIRSFIYDLIMNFYIARMLLIELHSNNGPEEQE